MKLKTVNKLFTIIAAALLLSGCLPAEKTTQCGKNEAFNATRRTCVPTLGGASTNTVFINSKLPSNSYTTALNGAPVNHSIAVSDVYNYGYVSKWFLHFSGGGSNISSMVATNTTTYSFNPSFSYGAGSYVLEAVIYSDEGETLDSVSWNISINAQSAPQLIQPTPNAGSFTYASSVTSASLSIDLDNDDGLDGIATWLVDGVQTTSSNFNASTPGFSTTINPQGLGVGIHTVEIKIAHLFNAANIYDSHVWIINVVDPDLPIINMAATDPSFGHTIIAVDGIAYSSGGYLYDHDSDPQTALDRIDTKPLSGGTPGICVTVDDWDKNNDGTADVYLKFDINGAQQGAIQYLTANTYCITSDLSTQILANSEIGVSKNLNITTYRNGTNSMVEQMTWALNVIPKNSAPIIRISSNSDSFGCSASSEVYHTGCSLTQSVDDNLDGDYADGTDVNNVAKFAIDITQDFETDYANPSSVYGEDNSSVYFQVKKVGDAGMQDIDGTSDYTRASCSVTSGASKASITDSPTPSGAVTTYYCDLSFDAFNANGPVPAGDYIVKAYVTDAGSQWTGLPKDSNFVTWEVAVTETQSAPVIMAQDFAGGSIASNESHITSSLDGAGCTDSGIVLDSGDNVNEGQYVILHTIVKDLERDHLSASVKMEKLVDGPGVFYEVFPFQLVTRTDDNEYFDIQSCFQVPEWANNSGISQVSLFSTVKDQPDNLATSVQVSNSGADIFLMNIVNVNPAPVFADYSSPTENVRNLALDTSAAAEPTYVIPGHPFSITPPSYSDASVYDGNVVTWQWQVCLGDPSVLCAPGGAGWANIPGANSTNNASPNLVWTPSPDIQTTTNANLRICLGDDGDGNPADCADPRQQSRKTYTNITVNPNNTLVNSTSETPTGSGVASWYDQTNEHLYTAFGAGTNLVVEKMSLDEFGNWTKIHSMIIPSDDTTPQALSELSMTGIDGSAVIIAYKISDSGTPVPRIRRLNISNQKLTFNYTGIFDATETGDFDMLAGTDSTGPMAAIDNTTFALGAPGELDITFSAAPTLGSIGLRLSDQATTVTLTYNSAAWCSGGCADQNTTATSLANAINTDPQLSEEYVASAAAGTVTVIGAIANDYLDLDAELSISLGKIISQGSNWYVPFCDGGNFMKASVVVGSDINTSLDGVIPGVKFLNTKQNCSEVRMAPQGGTDFALTMVADANLHAYLLDSGVNITADLEYAHNLTGFALIKNHSLSVDSNGVLYTAGVSETSAGETYLNAAVFASDLSEVSASAWFTGSSNELSQAGIEKVEIAANTLADGGALIALTTSSDHATIPNQAHFAMITQNLGDLTENILFADYQMATVASSPKLNINSTYSSGSIWLSPMIDLPMGHANTGDGAPADNTQPSVFFGFHEDNAGVAETRIGIYNASPENSSSNDVGASGSYPAFISL